MNERTADAVLYSALDFVVPIVLPVGELRPTRYAAGEAVGWVYHHKVRYEPFGPGDTLVSPDSEEAVAQLRVLCCLWFRAVFHPHRAFVETVTRPAGGRRHAGPGRYVDRYFDTSIWLTAEEIEGFPAFLTHLLALPRATYRRLLTCVRAFADSLEALPTNFDVAYALLVYLLETLCLEAAGEYRPTWAEYDEGVRIKIDRACQPQPEVGDAIRSALLAAPHLKLKKRFVEFIAATVGDEFFTAEAEDRVNPVRKSELRRALATLYDTRSGYVHQLRGVSVEQRVTAVDPKQDTTVWEHGTYLTYSGLVRLCRHVLVRFVLTRPTVEQEDVPDWRGQLPGIIRIRMAPQYWVWRTEGFSAAHAPRYFGGVVDHVLSAMQNAVEGVVDLGPLMQEIERLLPQSGTEHRPALLATYWLYNRIMAAPHVRPGWQEVVGKYDTLIDEDRFEFLVVEALLGLALDGDPSRAETNYRNYLAARHRPAALRVPAAVELGVLGLLANARLAAGDSHGFARLVDEAVTDAPGRPDAQRMLSEARAACRPVDIHLLVTGRPVPPDEALDYTI